MPPIRRFIVLFAIGAVSYIAYHAHPPYPTVPTGPPGSNQSTESDPSFSQQMREIGLGQALDLRVAGATAPVLSVSHDLGPHDLGPHDLGPHDLGPHDLGPHDLLSNGLVSQHTIVAFGDFHGDLGCALFWIKKAGLVRGDLSVTSTSQSWTYTDWGSTMVFTGDYIDRRGPQSKEVLMLVRALQMRFLHNVIALLGNHELEALLDRKSSKDRRQVVSYSSSYVNPYELLNWVPQQEITADTRATIEKISRTLIDRVYGEGRRGVILSPDGPGSIVDLVEPASFRPIVRRELKLLQRAYVDGYSSESLIGKWLESLPITYASRDGKLMFVHGGIRVEHLKEGGELRGGLADFVALNEKFRQNAGTESLAKFIFQSDAARVVNDLLNYRDNHGKCDTIETVKRTTGVSQLVVGHTPGETVRVKCGGSFIAANSMLSRWIRNPDSGNDYCKGTETETSLNKRFTCRAVGECMGEIVKMVKTDSGWISAVVKA